MSPIGLLPDREMNKFNLQTRKSRQVNGQPPYADRGKNGWDDPTIGIVLDFWNLGAGAVVSSGTSGFVWRDGISENQMI